MRFFAEITCVEQNSLCEVLWLSCVIVNRLFAAVIKSSKLIILKLSMYFKKCLGEVDFRNFYVCFKFLWEKSISITEKNSSDLIIL